MTSEGDGSSNLSFPAAVIEACEVTMAALSKLMSAVLHVGEAGHGDAVGDERRLVRVARLEDRALRFKAEGVAPRRRVAVGLDPAGDHPARLAEIEGGRLDDDDLVGDVPAQLQRPLVDLHRLLGIAEGEDAGADVELHRRVGDRTVGGVADGRVPEERHVGVEPAFLVAELREDIGKGQLREDRRHRPLAGGRVLVALEGRRPAAAETGAREGGGEVGGCRIDGDVEVGVRQGPLLSVLGVPHVDLAVDQGKMQEARPDRGADRGLEPVIDDLHGAEDVGEAAIGADRLGRWRRARRLAGGVHGRRIAEKDLPVG